jgi:antitoxin component YwqK of YwqJK toxin-antitoxin module
MKQFFSFVAIWALTAITSFSQTDTVFNQLDNNGLKQGYWKKNYPNGKLMYKGCFKDGKPAGEMRRYYETGELKAVMEYKDGVNRVFAKIYYDTGELASEGFYMDEKKDSTWKYYSYYTNTLTSIESYKKGIKNGFEKHFYQNQQVSEEIEWKNNLKDGVWNQYFDNGKPKLKTTNVQDKVHGVYVVYYPDGNLYILGGYLENKRHGKWVFYDVNKQVKSEIIYNYGKADNEEEIMKKDSAYFQMIEKNIGKFSEPTPDDVLPRGLE